MRKPLSLLLPGICFIGFSQTGKVGINTTTPTENLDVRGTMRVRSLPTTGTASAIYTTGADTSTSTPSQTFTGTTPVVADAFGVLGKNPNADMINTNPSTEANATFLVKRYTLTESGGGVPNPVARTYDTGVSTADWQGIMSNIMFTINSGPTTTGPFVSGGVFNYRLSAGSDGKWKIIGDIRSLQESAVIDVLFIKSKYVAADNRTN